VWGFTNWFILEGRSAVIAIIIIFYFIYPWSSSSLSSLWSSLSSSSSLWSTSIRSGTA
jgi:hypothetical protein